MRHPRRGFATVTAMALIALMAMALTTMMWRIGHEAHGLRGQRLEAELRQLLIAGGAASSQFIARGQEERTLDLPEALAARGGSVVLRLDEGRIDFERRIHVQATLDGATRRQTLRYIRGQQGWALVEATLERPAARQEPDSP